MVILDFGENIVFVSLSLYNSLTINIEISIMQNRRLKLKQTRKEMFENKYNLF